MLILIERIKKIRAAVPTKPKQFQLSIPDAFQNLVMKLLAKKPEERYPTATKLLAELTHVGKLHGARA